MKELYFYRFLMICLVLGATFLAGHHYGGPVIHQVSDQLSFAIPSRSTNDVRVKPPARTAESPDRANTKWNRSTNLSHSNKLSPSSNMPLAQATFQPITTPQIITTTRQPIAMPQPIAMSQPLRSNPSTANFPPGSFYPPGSIYPPGHGPHRLTQPHHGVAFHNLNQPVIPTSQPNYAPQPPRIQASQPNYPIHSQPPIQASPGNLPPAQNWRPPTAHLQPSATMATQPTAIHIVPQAQKWGPNAAPLPDSASNQGGSLELPSFPSTPPTKPTCPCQKDSVAGDQPKCTSCQKANKATTASDAAASKPTSHVVDEILAIRKRLGGNQMKLILVADDPAESDRAVFEETIARLAERQSTMPSKPKKSDKPATDEKPNSP